MSSSPCTQCGTATRSVTGLCHDCRGGSKGRGIPVKDQLAADALSAEEEAQALCAQVDPEIFFVAKGESPRPAQRVCRACPIKVRCLEVALANDERFGIYGGTTPNERIRMRNFRVAS